MFGLGFSAFVTMNHFPKWPSKVCQSGTLGNRHEAGQLRMVPNGSNLWSVSRSLDVSNRVIYVREKTKVKTNTESCSSPAPPGPASRKLNIDAQCTRVERHPHFFSGDDSLIQII